MSEVALAATVRVLARGSQNVTKNLRKNLLNEKNQRGQGREKRRPRPGAAPIQTQTKANMQT